MESNQNINNISMLLHMCFCLCLCAELHMGVFADAVLLKFSQNSRPKRLFHIWNTHWLWVLVFNRFFHAEYHILLGITGVSLCIQFISMPLMLHKRSWASYRTILALFHFIYTRCSYYFASRWKNLDRFFSFCSFISVQWLVMERAKDSHFLRMHLFSTTIFTHERKMLSNRYFNNFFTYSTWIFDFFFRLTCTAYCLASLPP